MRQYLNLLEDVIENGRDRPDRTGVGTRSVFGRQVRFDLSEGFPIVTTKFVHFRSVLVELLWMLSGRTNVEWLQERGVTIWDEWADAQGDLGSVYGAQWRGWSGFDCDIDQIRQVEDNLRTDPYSRRHIVSAWNVEDLPDMALAPCHVLFQFYVDDSRLSCHMYQRSADIFLGVPFNIASYAILTEMFSRALGYSPGDLVISYGDLHLYHNHFNQARLQLTREPKPLPMLMIPPKRSVLDYTENDVELVGYEHHPRIKAEVAV